MNHDEICIVEEKGELAAKLGQVIDQRYWDLTIFFQPFAVPYPKMNYRGKCKSACRMQGEKKILQVSPYFAELLPLQANKRELTSLGDGS